MRASEQGRLSIALASASLLCTLGPISAFAQDDVYGEVETAAPTAAPAPAPQPAPTAPPAVVPADRAAPLLSPPASAPAAAAAPLTPASPPPQAEAPAAPAEPELSDDAATLRALSQNPTSELRLLGGMAFGTGLRFNNPYRLKTQLGDTPESISLTSGYVDFGVAAALGPPDGFQHGAALRLSIALSGVPQEVLAPSYFIAYRGGNQAMVFGRVGGALALEPDLNLGGEVAVGGAYFITAGIGASAEMVFDLFYGAGTTQVRYATYPILSAQLGVVVDYEVLP